MNLAMLGRDIFVRHTNTDGHAFVSQHRVWDAQRFLAARADEAAKLNADVKDGGRRLAKCEQITDDQYRKERK